MKVLSLSNGKQKDAGVRAGFIITDVNKVSVSSKEDLERIMMKSENKKPALIEGVYPDGEYSYYVLKP